MNRVWIFILSKQLDAAGLQALQEAGGQFAAGWTAHDSKLSASFSIFRNRIVIVKVNEDIHAASGCSIDKLTRFMKEMEKQFGVQLLNRLLVAYEDAAGELQVRPSSEIKNLLQSGELSSQTAVYNTAAANEQELQNWRQPLRETWLNKFLVNA